ncbi:MAG: hypothetical protein RMI89_00015 [Gloeomargarita sp. SKYBB_i_bin120]|nr:hypothetical protein [Gloeomargarita sp. SKYG98]MCS7291348.1 hypothetical protein [Gloeomargarita sp. SKYB120]MDW8176907.1 hypothetical protein [Gloeomargarita sp. SKYBB_i_bin120]
MFGYFQQVALRIELRADKEQIRQALVEPAALQQWWFAGWPLQTPVAPGRSAELRWSGLIPIRARVQRLGTDLLQWEFCGGVDGLQTWSWGDGWVQVQLEAVSLLPLSVGQVWQLWRLRDYLRRRS